MPKELHRKLKKEAEKKGLTGNRKARYIYGTLCRIAQKPKGKKK